MQKKTEEHRNKKPNILSSLPVRILRQLFNMYNNKFCLICNAAHNGITCKNFKPKDYFPELVEIYNLHNHTRFESYSNEEIKAILDAFKQVGMIGNSHYKVFADYDTSHN